jgi:hypothetical protein
MKLKIFVCSIIISFACSSNNDKQNVTKMILMEKEIDSLKMLPYTSDAVKTRLIETRLNEVTKEYKTFLKTLSKTTSWYKCRNLPFEPILMELEKSYNISDFDVLGWCTGYNNKTLGEMRLSPPDATFITLPIKWNMEDVSKIKNIIMKTYSFNPKEAIYQDDIVALEWTGSKYNVRVIDLSEGGYIGILFCLK